jgi:hypothetical protein
MAISLATQKGRKDDQCLSLAQAPTKMYDTLSEKITKAKRAGNVVKVVENLPSRCKALSSNPSMPK